ncbi:L,D-transpeptidase [Candidatus Woesearchaeota archaeon]|nr:L,D-transpeptidase [Candidatus Woesearchaeota archaeon]
MEGMHRRDFLKKSSLLTLGLLAAPEKLFSSSSLDDAISLNEAVSLSEDQKIVVNLPGYELKLFNYQDGKIAREYKFTVGVGKGRYWRHPTPITTGRVVDKRPWIHFFFENDKPERGAKIGDVITETWTFDGQGNPVKYPMPYEKMRGLGTLMRMPSGYMNPGFVIHSTTDEFTLGAATSNGCIRLGMEDMLKLYELVAPDAKQKGGPKQPIPLKYPVPIQTLYELVEIKDSRVVIHRDIYDKGIDYVDEFKKQLAASDWLKELTGDDALSMFDYDLIKKEFAGAQEQFKEAHRDILLKLFKPFPDNYISPEMRQKLHKAYSIADLMRK